MEKFANILFLKLISESEQIKQASGISSSFDLSCSWDAIKDVTPTSRIDYINTMVYQRLNSLYKTEIFTPLTIRDNYILTEIMDKLDPLTLTDVDSDVKGDAFEYFLKASTASKNDLGEYFTPRHIVKTMVRLVNPRIGEKVYDPFCGTGGFLIESFRHIYNNMPRTPETEKMLRKSTIYGNEITNTARITKMNMILAGDGHSNIHMQDSLSHPIDGAYDVVLANMPYSQKTNHGHLYDLPTTNGDSICVQHCMKAINAMSENGRMALVVPEGFLFRRDLARTREYLLKNAQLQSIISLPQGVFLPYTGVKTDIIFATKVNQKIPTAEKQKTFWYFDVKSDGYTLDNHRRKLDAPSDLTKYEEYRKLDNDQFDEMLQVGFQIIQLEKVRENSFILVGNRYKEQAQIVSEYNITNLSDNAEFIRGVAFPKSAQKTFKGNHLGIVTTRAAQEDGICEKHIVYIDNEFTRENKLLKYGDILISLANSLKHVGRVTFVDNDYENLSTGAFMGIIRPDATRIIPKLLYHIMQSDSAKEYFRINANTTTNISNLTFDDLGKFSFPLPPISVQKQVVNEIEHYQQIVNHAAGIIDSYKPYLPIKAEWTKVRVQDLFSVVSDNVDPKTQSGEVNYIGLENIESSTGRLLGEITAEMQSIKSMKRIFRRGDLLYGKLRPKLNKVLYAEFDGICSTDIIVLRPKDDSVLAEYYSYLMRMEEFNSMVLNGVSGGQLPRVDMNYFLGLPISKVPQNEQMDALAQLKTEMELIEPSKKLHNIFVTKVKSKVNEIWGKQ